MDFCSMKRKELQSLCKKNGIPANLSNVEMASRLAAVQKVMKQKNFKSCLKSLEIGVCSDDDESERVKIEGGKRVRFSPENETFEFEKTDPREMRLLARKRRALGNNRVVVDGNLSNEDDDVGHVVGCIEKVLGRNLRRNSMVKSNTGVGSEDVNHVGKNAEKENVGRNLRRKSMVKSNMGVGSEDVSNVGKNVEMENAGRSLRLHSKRVERNEGLALLLPWAEKKAKKGRKGHETIDTVAVSPDKLADHMRNASKVTRRSLRSRGITAENLGRTGGGGAGVMEGNDLVKKDLNQKGEKDAQILRRSVRHMEKTKGEDLLSVSKGRVQNISSNDGAAKNHEDNCTQIELDNRKRKRVRKKAASGKDKPIEEVFHSDVDKNGNLEKPVDGNTVVGRRVQSRDVEVNGLADKCFTRKSNCRRTMNDERGGSSIPVQAAKRSTSQTGKQKVDASLTKQVADDVVQSADDTSQIDNQRGQPVSEASETRDSIMEKADTVIADGPSNEQTIPGGAAPDHSIEEKMNEEWEGQYHTTLGTTSAEQRKKKFDATIQISTNDSEYSVAYDTRTSEDCMGLNGSNKKTPQNARVHACSPARSEVAALPMLQKSSDCETKPSAQVKNSLDNHLKLHVAAVDDFQGGITSTRASTRELDITGPVCHTDCELTSCSGIVLGDSKLGNDKVVSNKRERPLNHGRNEKLPKQVIGLDDCPGTNGTSESKNAAKTGMLNHAIAIAHTIDDQVIVKEEADVSSGKCESVSGEAECTTPEGFGRQGSNPFISQVPVVMCSEVNLEADFQDDIAMDGLALFAEVSPATLCEPTEEDEDAKIVRPLHNQEAGTGRITKESRKDDSPKKDGSKDVPVSSILRGNLYLQCPVEGDVPAVLELPKKIEESYAETSRDLACFENSSKQDSFVQNDKFTAAKPLEVVDHYSAHPKFLGLVLEHDATNPYKNEELESEKGTGVSNSNKDVDTGATNDSSGCISAESDIIEFSERSSWKTAEALEGSTSLHGDESTSPSLSQANQSSYPGSFISTNDVENTKLADTPEISVRHDDNSADRSRSCSFPSRIRQEDAHEICQVQDNSSLINIEETNCSLEVLLDSFIPQSQEYENRNTPLPASDMEQAEVKDDVCAIALEPQSLAGDEEEVTNETEERMQDTALEDFGGKGLNQFVSQETAMICSEVNLEGDSHDHIVIDGLTLFAEASPATICEPTEEDEETKTVTLSDKEEAGTSGNTKKSRIDDSQNKHGYEDTSKSLIIGRNLYLQCQAEGDFTAVSGLPKKIEERYSETSRDLACFENSSVQNCVVQKDKLTAAKLQGQGGGSNDPRFLRLVFEHDATNPSKKKELESEKGAVVSISKRDADIGATNESSQCILAESDKMKFLEQSFGKTAKALEVGMSYHGDQRASPLLDQANQSLHQTNLISSSGIKDTRNEVSELISITKKVIHVDKHRISARHDDNSADLRSRSCTFPSRIMQEHVHEICQKQDKSSLTDIEKANSSLEVVHDSVMPQECENGNILHPACNKDQAEAKDVCPVVLEPQPLAGDEKLNDEINEPMQDAAEFRCLSLLDDYAGTNNINVAPEESEHAEVNDPEGACIARNRNLVHDNPGNLQRSPSVIAEVSDDFVDLGLCNSEGVELSGDDGISRIQQQHMDEGQLDGLLQEEASATGADHLEHINKGQLDGLSQEEASPMGTDHLASNKKSEDSQSLTCANDGICSAQHNDHKENSCLDEIEEQQLYESAAVINHHNAEGVDEKTSVVLMGNIHATTESSGEKNLVKVANTWKMGCRELHSSPVSIINLEANNEDAEANCDATKDMLHPAVVEHEPQLPSGYEKVTEEIEEALEDTSAARAYDSVAIGEVDVILKESEHGEDTCIFKSDDLMSGRSDDLQSFPSKIGKIADVITEHEKSNNYEEESGADQAFESNVPEFDEHMLLNNDKCDEECRDQMHNVESCMFSNWEIDLIWGDMTSSGNTQSLVKEQIVSDNIQLADLGELTSTHCTTEVMEERGATGHKVTDVPGVNQETQPAEEQVIDLKLLLNPSEQNPDCSSGAVIEASRPDCHNNQCCPPNANYSDEVPENAEDLHANDHAGSKVAISSMIKRKNIRSILIHGTPQKRPPVIHDMKENTQNLKELQIVDVTAARPVLKRKALEDLRK